MQSLQFPTRVLVPLITVALLMVSASYVSAETWYVTPLSECLENLTNGSCLTLSQVAANTARYFTEQTTLILLPGEHVLDSLLLVRNIPFSVVISTPFNATVALNCSESGTLIFQDIAQLHIKGIHFYGCADIQIIYVEFFMLRNCHLNGQVFSTTQFVPPMSYSGLYLRGVSSANVSKGTFSFFNSFSYGGALYADRCYKLNIANSSFQYNNGPALRAADTNVVVNSVTFHDNIASSNGAAIYTTANSNGKELFISNSRFKDNEAIRGVAVYATNIDVRVDNVVFFGNTASYGGAAIYTWSAARNRNYLQVINSSFTNHISIHYGGCAIIAHGKSNVVILDSWFKNNSAKSRYAFGGALNLWNSANTVIENSTFISNKADEGGSIYAQRSVLVIVSSLFQFNEAISGAAVSAIDTDTKLDDVRFHDNTASNDGAAIHTRNSANNTNYLQVINSLFLNQSSNNSLGNAYGGGAIFASVKGDIVILQSRFERNRAKGLHGSGGALYVSSNANTTIENTTFISNRATHRGGSIRAIHSNVTIYNNMIADNTASSAVAGTSQLGGAVDMYACNVTIDNSMFMNNAAVGEGDYGEGGAMFLISCQVEITTCVFANNTALGTSFNSSNVYGGGAISLSCTNITIDDSVFSDNKVKQGHGGAISVKWYLSERVLIENSDFIRNVAQYNGGAISASEVRVGLFNTLFSNNTAYGNGEALYFEFSKCSSDGHLNVQEHRGGRTVIYSFRSDLFISSNATISNNCGSLLAVDSNVTFQANTAFINNGGKDCTTEITEGLQQGGAVTTFQSNIVFEDGVYLIGNHAENGGAISTVESQLNMNGDTTISHNSAQQSGGGIYAYQSQLNFMGTNNITDNTAGSEGGGIHAISSTTRLLGDGVYFRRSHIHHLYFRGNHASRGGGMSLVSNAKLYIVKRFSEVSDTVSCARQHWLSINFTDNSANYGGAIYVRDDTKPGTCASIPSSTQPTVTSECFFQIFTHMISFSRILSFCESTTNHVVQPAVHNLRNIYFTNNSATKSGDSLYGGLLDRCTLSPLAEMLRYHRRYTRSNKNENDSVYTITDIEKHSIASDAVRVCFCNGDEPDCSYQPDTVRVRKGERFVLPVVAVDQVGRPMPSSIHSSLLSQGGTFSEGQLLQTTSETCTELVYNILSPHDSEQLLLHAEGPCKDIGISQRSINLTFLPCDCPIGFEPFNTETDCQCDCDSTFKPFITNCSIETKSLLRQSDFWITYVQPISNSTSRGYVIHPNCPYDYCYPPSESISIKLNDSDKADEQCAFNRSGVLCGSCQEGLSLSLGSSRCIPCSNHWLALLIPFAIAGIALVAFLLVLNLTVAVGTINGLIFYANIIAANSEVFFPFENSHFLTIVISWLNLDFGFETCFYSGMSGYAKVWLQLAYPLYVIFLVAMVIIFGDWIIIRKRCSNILSKYSPKTNPVAVLSTLILLSYAKLLRMIIAALSFTTLEYPDGSHKKVWLYDANVPYAEGKHIPLILASTLILLVGLMYTILLFFWQWLLKFPSDSILKWITEHSTLVDTAYTRLRNTRLYTLYNRIYSSLYSFMDTYHAPYNFKHRYWAGLLLLVRVFFYIVASFKHIIGHPNVNLLVIIIVVGALLYLCQSVYKQRPLNSLESSFLFNLLTFSAGTIYLRETNGNQAALAYISVTIAYITFLGILMYHVVKFMLKKCLQLLGTKYCHTRGESVSIQQFERGPCFSINNENTNERIVPITEIDGLPRKDSINLNSNEMMETEP